MQAIENLSKKKASDIKKLDNRKYRDERGVFLVQGEKIVKDVLESNWKVAMVCGTEKFFKENIEKVRSKTNHYFLSPENQLNEIGYFTSNNSALAVVQKQNVERVEIESSLTIVLDSISDPGNLGTIIRSAAWFGVKSIVCSTNSVDIYNPKTIQATMGAFLHVNVSYEDLEKYLEREGSKKTVFAADIKGESIYEDELPCGSIVVFGNESHGIEPKLYKYIKKTFRIPSRNYHVESLNVAVSAGIVLSEVFRK